MSPSSYHRSGRRRAPVLLNALIASGCLTLASCGGGGDGGTAVSGPTGPDGTAVATYTVSGTISAGPAQVVDSDTNDPNQADHKPNNTFDTLQPLPNPAWAIGYVTIPGAQPAGAVSAAGDTVDGYSLQLVAGQVIELDFPGDASTVDIDLYMYDAQRQMVGRSIGTNSYECIRVAADGTYAIAVELYADGSSRGSHYQLRVSPPGESSCANGQVAPSTLIEGQIVATPNPVTAAATVAPGEVSVKAAAAGLTVLAGDGVDGGSVLIEVPQDLAALTTAFSANRAAGTPASGDRVVAKAAAAAAGDRTWRASLSPQARRLRETIDLSKAMVASGQYRSATPNFRIQALADRVVAFPPNDRDYARQKWHYDAISLSAAASQLAGFTPTVNTAPIVAVLDSGIIANHPDLQGQLVAGYDFVSDLNNGDGDGMDPNPDDPDTEPGSVFHGTHVAGTVAADTNNGIGVAGVAPVARIMPLRALATSGGSYFDLEQAIRFAAGLSNASGLTPPRRADVINMSLGASGVSCQAGPQQLFNEVRAAGVVVVAAAGNESNETTVSPVGFPANCASVMSVAAVDARLERAYYSNVGPENWVAAPGGDVRVSTTGNGLPDGVYSTVGTMTGRGRSPSYTYLQGTSMASPHVAGVVALMRWVNPQLPAATIDQWISQGRIVDDLGTPGRDQQFGYGLINASKAVEMALQSLGGGTGPAVGQVVAQPSSIGLGRVAESAEFNLLAAGPSAAERVASVTVDSAVIAVAPKPGAVDPATNLGTYVVTAVRSAMADNTSAYPNVVVNLTPARQFTIPVAIERRGGVGGGGGSVGPVYVLIINPDAPEDGVAVASGVVQSPTAEGYQYSVPVPVTSRRIWVVAGTDLDNDGQICSSGEGCGAYPTLSGQRQILDLTGNLTGINFPIAPFAGVNPQITSALTRLD